MPDARRPFAGRPERGVSPAPVPGVLVPDVPVTVRGQSCARLREIARHGVLLLYGRAVDSTAIRTIALAATHAPIRLHALAAVDTSGLFTAATQAEENEVWVVRPDAHIAAVVDGTDPQALAAALQRAVGADTVEVRRPECVSL